MSEGHSILPPSGSPEWQPCPGSVPMSVGISEEETDDTRAGEATHWIGEGMLKGNDETGIQAPNGVIINDDMIDAAEIYVDDVRNLAGDNPIVVEQPVMIPDVHEQCWGTPDAWSFNTRTATLHIWDLKYGHSGVQAIDNWQMVCYINGILNGITKGRALQDLGVHVVATIVQPRCYDGNGVFRRWSVPAVELRAHINKLNMAAEEALGENPTLHTGAHCHYCKARYQCPALQQATSVFVDYSQAAVPQVLSNETMGYELRVLNEAYNLIKYRKDAMETEALARSMDGQLIPGFAAEQGMSKNRWLFPDDEVAAMGDTLGVNLLAEPKLITPGQAGKLIDPEVIKSYYGKQPTAMKLVVDDNTKAKNIFG